MCVFCLAKVFTSYRHEELDEFDCWNAVQMPLQDIVIMVESVFGMEQAQLLACSF